MKILSISFLALATFGVSQTAFADERCNIIYGKHEITGKFQKKVVQGSYVVTTNPDVKFDNILQTPASNVRLVAVSGTKTVIHGFYRHRLDQPITFTKLLLQDKNGKTLFSLFDESGIQDKGSLVLNRAVFSSDGKKALLVLDNPEKRSYFGKSNQFILVDLTTGKKTAIKSNVELAEWRVAVDLDRLSNYPMAFSADSKTLLISSDNGIEVIDVATGKERAFLDRKSFGYKSQFDQYGKDEILEEAEWRSIEAEERMTRVSFSPDGSRVLVSFANDLPVLFDIQANKIVKKIKLPKNAEFKWFQMMDDENAIGVFSGDTLSVSQWNAKANRFTEIYSQLSRRATLDALETNGGVTVALITERLNKGIAERFVAFTGAGTVVELDAAATQYLLKQERLFFTQAGSSRVIVSPKGTHAVVVPYEFGGTSQAYVFNTKTGKLEKTIEFDLDYADQAQNAVWFNLDGRSLFVRGKSSVKVIELK